MSPLQSPRMWSSLAALALALTLAAAIAYVATVVNRPPVIVSWQAEPTHVPRNASALLRVSASDPDGGALRYDYKAQKGRVAADAARPQEARYMPPADSSTSDAVTVVVTDSHGFTASATTVLTLEAAPPSPAATDTPREPQPTPEAVAPPPAPDDPEPAPVRAASTTPTSAPPPAAPAKPRAVPTRDPRAPRGPNHAPVLEKGTTIEGLGSGSVVLVANGYEPDGDPLQHSWDTKGCFDVIRETSDSIEVKFGYCTWGVIRLTWTDPYGLSAFAEWTISK